VSNDDMPTALFVEFGTKNNPRHRTLGNALDAAGRTLTEGAPMSECTVTVYHPTSPCQQRGPS
jgi:hypothetical protein